MVDRTAITERENPSLRNHIEEILSSCNLADKAGLIYPELSESSHGALSHGLSPFEEDLISPYKQFIPVEAVEGVDVRSSVNAQLMEMILDIKSDLDRLKAGGLEYERLINKLRSYSYLAVLTNISLVIRYARNSLNGARDNTEPFTVHTSFTPEDMLQEVIVNVSEQIVRNYNGSVNLDDYISARALWQSEGILQNNFATGTYGSLLYSKRREHAQFLMVLAEKDPKNNSRSIDPFSYIAISHLAPLLQSWTEFTPEVIYKILTTESKSLESSISEVLQKASTNEKNNYDNKYIVDLFKRMRKRVAKRRFMHITEILRLPEDIDQLLTVDSNEAEIDLRAYVQYLLDRLDPEQRLIVELHYGFSGDDPKSIREISEKVSKSRKQVMRALSLAHSSIIKGARDSRLLNVKK